MDPVNEEGHSYFVMYQCEFARDLMHRLAGREISFRAVLTYGPFEHYRLGDDPYYYGPALIRAYRVEKELKITGLVMDDHCNRYSHVFTSKPFDAGWHYVFLTQALDNFEDVYGAMIPLPRIIVHETELGWMLGPELETLRYSVITARAHPDPAVRKKHAATLSMYEARYPRCVASLKGQEFRMEAVSDEFDWSKVRERMKDDFKWASVRKPPRAGRTPANRQR